ncbi:hypothetical protein EG877_16025 [Enterococcus faecalis]|nr:hypothetical protein EG877_16025 [Enterococcus faecalis]
MGRTDRGGCGRGGGGWWEEWGNWGRGKWGEEEGGRGGGSRHRGSGGRRGTGKKKKEKKNTLCVCTRDRGERGEEREGRGGGGRGRWRSLASPHPAPSPVPALALSFANLLPLALPAPLLPPIHPSISPGRARTAAMVNGPAAWTRLMNGEAGGGKEEGGRGVSGGKKGLLAAVDGCSVRGGEYAEMMERGRASCYVCVCGKESARGRVREVGEAGAEIESGESSQGPGLRRRERRRAPQTAARGRVCVCVVCVNHER